jgi:hypothetical protein
MKHEHEFNNRIAAQRAILRVVNQTRWDNEQLFGLSSKAIDRWISVNKIGQGSRLAKLLKEASENLFFLANKSQEQISDDYKAIRAELVAACDAIEIELRGTTA